jgi:hypothetical protein
MGRALRILTCAASAVAISVAAAASSDGVPPASGLVGGHYDAATGRFTPLPETADPAAAPITIRGKLVIKIAADIKSAVPKSFDVLAIGTASVTDAQFTGSAGKRFSLKRVGSKATGSVTLPYFMTVLSTTRQMRVLVTVFLSPGAGARPFIQLTQTITVPANNTTTVLNFPAAL